jgi:glycosyltransferase involved in cell wall biosynthesis
MMSSVSVIVPAFNEAEVLPEFHRRLMSVLDALDREFEVLYINDGSTDDTLDILVGFAEATRNVGVIDFSRNFGKEVAVTAGLEYASGDAVVVIDADLQDPPELIPEMVALWEQGGDVVYARRRRRLGEALIKRITAKLFYLVIRRVSSTRIPEDTGDFRLLSRRAVDALNRLPEQHRFMKGLFSWIGFRQVAIEYDRDPRFAGETKWNYWRLWNFALEGITSFSAVPLKLASYVGLIAALFGFSYAGWIIFKTLMYGDPVAGYPSLMVVILCMGGIQLLGIGILGEYLARTFDETKHRPLYLVKDFRPSRLHQGSKIENTD